MGWMDTRMVALCGLLVFSTTAFVIAESYWAREPILPLKLLFHRNVMLPYLIQGLQVAAQMSVSFVRYNYKVRID